MEYMHRHIRMEICLIIKKANLKILFKKEKMLLFAIDVFALLKQTNKPYKMKAYFVNVLNSIQKL